MFKWFIALIATASISGEVTTAALPRFELYDSAGKLVSKPETWEACSALAKAMGKWSCVMRQTFTTIGTCEGEPAPVLPQDQRVLHHTLKPGSDTEYVFSEIGYVHNPLWPAGYPNCWILGDVPPDQPSAAVEPEPVMEPVIWSAALQAKWLSAPSEEARHKARICYATDQTPCPTTVMVPD